MTPFKDAYGLWRGEFNKGNKKPVWCPMCHDRDLDYERLLDSDDEYDGDMADEYQDEITNPALFAYTTVYAVCEECQNCIPYGPDLYYNPATNEYDLPRMLTHEEAVKAEAKIYAAQIESAGQMKLFGGKKQS